MLFDDFQHRGDLRLGEDPFGERIADFGSADRGADVERQIPELRGEGEQRLERFESPRARRGCAVKRVDRERGRRM